ncbi:Mg2+ transporter-C, MgtC family protein [Acinetobacter calcoaceticus]|nr:Mg2+ transporter-C, MgtC family protein [Acinetobacter calcoaceticus]
MELPMTMSLQTASFEEFITVIAAALGCGLLIGLERERSKLKHEYKTFAGFRSFAISALLGAVCFLFGIEIGIVGTLLIGAISIVSLKNQPNDPGVTTELAFIMTYFIGALCIWNISLAAGLAVIMTTILIAKQSMHGIASQWITESELRDGIFLLALLLIALPLVPNKPFWGPVLNPHVILKLLTLILFVQALAHIAKRLLSSKNALLLSSLASGFVSSTATIASLGLEVRSGKANATTNAGAALMSCVSTLIQTLIIVIGISFAWFKLIIFPTLIALVVLAVWAFILLRKAEPSTASPELDSRMFSLKEAIIIAGTLTLIQAGVYGLSLSLGDAGLIAGTLLASLFEIHAAIAAVIVQGEPDSAHMTPLLIAFLGGFAVHALAKSVNSAISGGLRYALAFVPAQLIHMAIFITLLWLNIHWF